MSSLLIKFILPNTYVPKRICDQYWSQTGKEILLCCLALLKALKMGAPHPNVISAPDQFPGLETWTDVFFHLWFSTLLREKPLCGLENSLFVCFYVFDNTPILYTLARE